MANRRFIDFPIAASVGDNDIVLIWQDGMNKQTTKGTLIQGAPTSLEGLTDVDIAGLINGQILQYNSTTGKWENVDRTDINLSELNDVSIVSPTNGQVLVYNSSTSKWENSSGGFVPYTGAVTTVDLGAQGLRAGYIRFDTSIVSVPDEQGLVYWDQSRSTAALIMNGVLQHIGQDTFFYVKNSTGSSISKGTAVRFNGTDGASGHLLIAPFLANGTYPSNYFMGVTAETIANGSFGQVMHFGELDGINTSGYTAGALLYASTTVAGGFQTTAPVAPNNIVLIAAAINSKNNGTILVRPTYGSNINQDEGVKITTPTTGDLLQLQAGGLWENKTVAQVIGSAYVPSTRTITINGTTQDLSANRTYNVGTVTSVGLSSATSGVTVGSTPITGSGTITIAIATATSTQNGLLSSTDWSTFNGKQNALTLTTTGTSGAATLVGSTLNIPQYQAAGTYVTAVTASSPLASSGGTTPNITIQQASGSQNGFLSSTDWTTFNNKQNALTNPVTGTGTSGQVAYFNGTTTITSESNLFWDATNDRLGIGTSSPQDPLHISTTGADKFIRIENSNSYTGIWINDSGTNSGWLLMSGYTNTTSPGDFAIREYGVQTSLVIKQTTGNLLVGTTTDNGYKLQVSGTSLFTGNTWMQSDLRFGADFAGSNTAIIKWQGSGASIANSLGLFTWADARDIQIGGKDVYFRSEAGTNRMVVLASGNVGIGTTSPTYKLTVTNSDTLTGTIAIGNSQYPGLIYSSALSGEFRIDNRSSAGAGYITFFPNGQENTLGNEAMRIATSRNVLIGTITDAGYKLDVNGTGRFLSGSSSTIGLIVGGAGGAGATRQGQLRFGDAGSVYKIQGGEDYSAFNFMIGSGTPLSLASNGAATFSSSVNVGGGGTNTDFRIYRTVAPSVYFSINAPGGSPNTSILGINGTDVMALNANGNVGINVNNPDVRLQVSPGTTANFIGALFTQGSSDGNFRAGFANGSGTTAASEHAKVGMWYGTTGNPVTHIGFLRGNSADSVGMTFNVNNSERMRINSDGNVGIGTTSPNAKFDIQSFGAQFVASYSSTKRLGISRLDTYSRIDSFTNGVQYDILSLNPDGGNVLVGTTTDNGNKLRVNGVGFFDQGVRTGQPVGTTTNNWLLGRALASGTSTPNRWIRVQIGLEYYDILAVYMGTL